MTRRRPHSTAPAPAFDLRIGELVLDGYAPGESRAIAEALEQELGRLLAAGPLPFAQRGGGVAALAFDRLDAGTVTHPPQASPRAIGRSAARAIVQRLRTVATGHDAPPRRRGGG